MYKLYIILGHLAAGKSTFAKALSKQLDCLCLIKDDIKEILGDRIGFQNREENLKLSQATFDLMEYVVKKYSFNRSPLILESNFRLSEIERMNSLSAELGFQIQYIVLTGDPELLYQRYLDRNPVRHIVHRSVGLADRDKYMDTLNDYTKFPLGEDTLYFDTTDPELPRFTDLVKTFRN